jgi:hypothetical protein
VERVESQKDRLGKVSYYKSADIQIAPILPSTWKYLDLENFKKKISTP